MKNSNKNGVFAAVLEAMRTHRFLTVGTVLCVAASVASSLIPPLLLARVIVCLKTICSACVLEVFQLSADYTLDKMYCYKHCFCFCNFLKANQTAQTS